MKDAPNETLKDRYEISNADIDLSFLNLEALNLFEFL